MTLCIRTGGVTVQHVLLLLYNTPLFLTAFILVSNKIEPMSLLREKSKTHNNERTAAVTKQEHNKHSTEQKVSKE